MHASLFLLLYNSMSRNELESRGRFLHIPGAMLGVGDGHVCSKGSFLYQIQRRSLVETKEEHVFLAQRNLH